MRSLKLLAGACAAVFLSIGSLGCTDADLAALIDQLGPLLDNVNISIDVNTGGGTAGGNNTVGDTTGGDIPAGGGSDDGSNGGSDDGSSGGSTSAALTATLASEGPGSGRAEWSVGVRTEFNVEIESGPPNETFEIVVDGISVGQLTLSDLGFGELEFRDPPDDNPGPNEVALPDNFPAVMAGTTVTIGPFSGVLAGAPTPPGDDSGGQVTPPGGSGAGRDVRLRIGLSGDAPGRGTAEWEVRPDRVRFKVEIEGGMPGAVLEIAVDGVVVGQLTLNGLGIGEIELRDPPDDNPDAHEFPLPGDFPPVGSGTVVTAGPYSGSF